jgi:hypothetical protein
MCVALPVAMRRSINKSLSALSRTLASYTARSVAMETSQQSTVTARYTVRCHGEDCVLHVPCTGYISYSGTVTAASLRRVLGVTADSEFSEVLRRVIYSDLELNDCVRNSAVIMGVCEYSSRVVNNVKTKASIEGVI